MIKKKLQIFAVGVYFCLSCVSVVAQRAGLANQTYWHDQERSLRYQPVGSDFVISNGRRRFNRALYGTNTAFRVETGDLPEFALYMPNIGGNLKFGLSSGKNSKWLVNAASITARYRPGSMLYEIRDPLLGPGTLQLTVLALDDGEGFIVRAEFQGIALNSSLVWAFGGAADIRLMRDGDLNTDPESVFDLKPEYCQDNKFEVSGNSFILHYGKENASRIRKQLTGVVPASSVTHLADAGQQQSPEKLLASLPSAAPVITGRVPVIKNDVLYFTIYNPQTKSKVDYASLPEIFSRAEEARKSLANRVQVNTPDPFINTLGGTLSIAADAIWQSPSYLHGAIGWRTRLNGWRGPYAGDPLGWHERAREHFSSYAKSQLVKPDVGPSVPDTERNLARQLEEIGTAVFSSGYICRSPGGSFAAHHYDMNLVYIDELLWHFQWTGDVDYVKEMWPVIKRHLAWEKRNFDADNDGLYDAYACIWASDALQYSGGAVTHSSAYNYRAFKIAARLAKLIGEDPMPYQTEAEKIHRAINTNLWMPSKGWYAEYQDALGLKRLHPAAGLWTVYHTIDSEVPDLFQAYQTLRYVDTEIPHLPVRAKGLPDEGYYVLSTTNWMPYTWSINNVVMAENLHAALAYWQSDKPDEGFKLWKSTLLDAMYLGSSPGNFVQVSFYDTARGETYRDFADEIGMAARTLVEGLFGIVPDALAGTLTIRPGLPQAWPQASLKIPDVSFDFKRKGKKDTYTITQAFARPLKLKLRAKAQAESVKSVSVNGRSVSWNNFDQAIDLPQIEITSQEATPSYIVEIEWQGARPETAQVAPTYSQQDPFTATFSQAKVLEVFDPQQVLKNTEISNRRIRALVAGENGHRTVFAKVSQGQFTWWAPLNFETRNPIDLVADLNQGKNGIKFQVKNNTASTVAGPLTVNPGPHAYSVKLTLNPGAVSREMTIPSDKAVIGSNRVSFEWGAGKKFTGSIINWEVGNHQHVKWEPVHLTNYFNDQVTNIFKPQYLAPRPTSPTLQMPKQGIGNWCYPLITANIDDSGIRKLASASNQIVLPQGIPFHTPGKTEERNIVFTSQWDNYPDEATIPLSGTAAHLYLLMAGSTNHMQSRVLNGEIIVKYMDGTAEHLGLRNPETWWPIEQDYFVDGYAFPLAAAKPVRVHLQTGLMTRDFDQYTTIKGYSTRVIDGGAATVLDLPLDATKQLKELTLKTVANEVVIGLMGITLMRGPA